MMLNVISSPSGLDLATRKQAAISEVITQAIGAEVS